METLDKSWPPTYNLRISKKAKRVYLKILPNRGLEIIVPVRQQKTFIATDLLAEKRTWITKHLATLTIPLLEAITTLNLRAINQTWHIEYKQTFSSQLRHAICHGEKINTLTLYGDVKDINRTNLWIKNWLKKLAQQHLLPWLRTLSITHQLEYQQAGVRAQQTLWGSCTAQKNISLNYKLLFIPPSYAEHVMLHELCHTKHLNHSQRFWNLLTKLDPATELHDRAVREGDRFVPAALIF